MLLNDQKRLEKVLKILPEETIARLIEMLADGRISDSHYKILSDFREYSNYISAMFDYKPVESNFRKLIGANNLLVAFLSQYFFREGNHHELYPEHRHSKDYRKFWDIHYRKLILLTKKFKNSYAAFLLKARKLPNISQTPISRNSAITTYNTGTRTIKAGQRSLVLPLESVEQDFCRVMYDGHKLGEAISWDVISEEIGDKEQDSKSELKIRDASRRVNKKAKSNLGIKKLFERENNNYIRTQ